MSHENLAVLKHIRVFLHKPKPPCVGPPDLQFVRLVLLYGLQLVLSRLVDRQLRSLILVKQSFCFFDGVSGLAPGLNHLVYLCVRPIDDVLEVSLYSLLKLDFLL